MCISAPALVRAQAAETTAPSERVAPDAEQAESAVDSAEYRAAIDEAVQEFKKGVWTQARGAFARAHELQPSARTFRGLGLSSFYLLDYVAARVAFEQALVDQRKPLPEVQRGELEQLLRRTVQETGRYQLRLSPVEATISVDDVIRTGSVVVLARGKHVLRARSGGFRAYESSVEVSGGEDSTLEIVLSQEPSATAALTPSAAASSTQAPAIQPAATQSARATPDHTWTLITLVAAPVFAVAGAAIWFNGKDKHDAIQKQCAAEDCTPPQARALESKAHLSAHETWSTIAFGTATASLLAAGLLYLFADRDSDAADHVSGSVTPSSAMLYVKL